MLSVLSPIMPHPWLLAESRCSSKLAPPHPWLLAESRCSSKPGELQRDSSPLAMVTTRRGLSPLEIERRSSRLTLDVPLEMRSSSLTLDLTLEMRREVERGEHDL